MTTWAQLRAASDRRICWYVMIEGVGYGLSAGALASAISDGTGCVRFWTRRPSYVTAALLAAQPEIELIHRECLLELPDVLSERVDPMGGMPELGELSFGALDDVTENVGGIYSQTSGWLTHLLRLVSQPVTALTADLTASTTTIPVGAGATIGTMTPDNVMFVGSEAMRVVSVAANNVTVARGHLDTDGVSHSARDLVYLYTPTLIRRVAKLYATSYSAGSIADDVLMGEYIVDGCRFDARFGAWQFSCRSISKHLQRKAPIRQDWATVVSVDALGVVVREPTPVPFPLQGWRIWTGSQANSVEHFHLATSNGEVVTARQPNATSALEIVRRGAVGTTAREINAGTILKRVFVADDGGVGDFRYSPNQAEVRTSADWAKTAHWIDIILAILTSSANVDDGLELINYAAEYPNFSWLPPGYGIGIPHSRIDWPSWWGVRARTPEHVFPWFVYGLASEPFGEMITREFLRPLNAYLLTEDGTVRIVLPRMPWSGSTIITIGTSDILTREVGRGLLEADADISVMASRLRGTVEYRLGPQRVPWTFDSASFDGLYGQRGYYSTADDALVIDAPSADPSRSEFLGLEAAGRLYRSRRPTIELSAQIDLDAGWQAGVGEVLAATLPGAPNLDGTRSWSGQRLEVEERELDPQTASYRTRAVGFGVASQIRKICPAAYVEQVISNTATTTTNRYTQADGADHGLPAVDAAAFAVNDVVRLYNRDLSLAAAGTQIIQGIANEDITLDGNFGGALAADLIIAYADQDEATSTQTTGWAFESLKTQASGAVSLYGEP